MINLNLLPKEKQKNIQLNKLFELLKKQVLLYSFILIIIILLFKTGDFLLQRELKNINEKINAEKIKYQDIEQEISAFNQNLILYNEINQKSINYSLLFKELNDLLTEKIYFNKLTAVKNEKDEQQKIKFIITGIYEKREDFLAWQDNFKNSQIFEDFDSPVANLINAELGNFYISFVYPINNQ